MKRIGLVLLLIALLVIAACLTWLFTRDYRDEAVQQEGGAPVVRSAPPEHVVKLQATYPGEQILSGYGAKSQSPQRDIEQVRELVSNSFMLVKNRDPREYATNEDLAEFLTGENRFKQVMLSGQHSIINEKGQLIDRWDNPLIVHVVSRKEVEIFSAGPDGIPWSEDDIGVARKQR